LHDDIGSSLSRMAILSEVVKQQIGASTGAAHEQLTEIADSGRRLVDAMSDIVWSIDPRRDDLGNLVARIREFGSSVLEMNAITWSADVSPTLEDLKLGPGERRQIFLILKEALTNAAKHAQCTSVRMRMAVVDHALVVEIRDDGRGVPAQTASHSAGQGLDSMKQRAVHIGGRLEIVSTPGDGTCVRLDVPVRKPAGPWSSSRT
jgi:signal transduction histidine kinase